MDVESCSNKRLVLKSFPSVVMMITIAAIPTAQIVLSLCIAIAFQQSQLLSGLHKCSNGSENIIFDVE